MDIIGKLYKMFRESAGVTTDSRTIKGGEMFFALKGENFDGNEYALKALESGAAYAVVDEGTPVSEAKDERIVPVENTLKALKELAAFHRNSVMVEGRRLTVIGLTGTNGKTTTKELIRSVLSVKYNVTATEGNLNNEIGVPLSVLKINDATQLAVIEMGASHPGDINSLVEVSQPDFGIITNVGKGHLLGFGSLDGVRKTKGELYDYISRTGGSVFLNEDLPYLREMAHERGIENVIPYGVKYDGASVLPMTAECPCLGMEIPLNCTSSLLLHTHLVGAYNADNVMTAIAVGRHFGVPVEDALKAIESYIPANSRSQMQKTESNTLIVDAYNANPVSMKAALRSLDALVAEHKVAMLGDMLELGADSVAEHKAIVYCVSDMNLDKVFLVGEEFRKALDSCGSECERISWFADSASLAEHLSKERLSGCTVLIKGSRGVRMERVSSSL